MASSYFDNAAKREWWSVHVEAWQRSGLTQVKYCAVHGLERNTFQRWLYALTDAKMAKMHVERVRSERRANRSKTGFKLSTDTRSQAVQAFWAMHVEALNWSGMSVRKYARAMLISPWTLSKWRDLIAAEEVIIDWRARLHPSARPQISTNISTSATGGGGEYGLTTADRLRGAKPVRRSFTDEEKRAIVMETLNVGVSVSSVARRHGIVTSMLFRWRVQFGFGGDDSARLVEVKITDAQHERAP